MELRGLLALVSVEEHFEVAGHEPNLRIRDVQPSPFFQNLTADQRHLVSDKARADSLPNLEIQADDVRCSHAATVGQLDEEEVFYLLSRGIPKLEAVRLVVFGFFGEVLEQLPLEDVKQELLRVTERKLRARG